MECVECGFENRSDARYCKQCGEPLPIQEETLAGPQQGQDTTCPFCGATVRSGARFCPRCGKQLTPKPDLSAPPATQPSMSAPTELPTQPSMPAPAVPAPSSRPSYQPPGRYAHPPYQPPPPPTTPPHADGRLPRWLLWLGGAALFLCLAALIVTAIVFGPDLVNPEEKPPAPPAGATTTASQEQSPTPDAQIAIDVPTSTVSVGEPLTITVTFTNTGELIVSNLSYQLVGDWMPYLESMTDPLVKYDAEVPPNTSTTGTFRLHAVQQGAAALQAYVMLDVHTDPRSTQGLLSEGTVIVAVATP